MVLSSSFCVFLVFLDELFPFHLLLFKFCGAKTCGPLFFSGGGITVYFSIYCRVNRF